MAVPQEEPLSLEHIQASELYPKRPLVTDDDTLQVPFPVLCGESVEFLGRTADGAIALSNYRLFIRFKDAFVNIPLGLIENIEARDIFFLHIFCKDAHTFRCTFATNEACVEWYKRLSLALRAPSKLQDLFAFAFHAWCRDTCARSDGTELTQAYQLCRMEDTTGGYSFDREVARLGFDLKTAWRITYVNEDYRISQSYPRLHIVPNSVKDEDIEAVAEFRASHRFPSVVWRDRNSGVVIARCSQPEVGWLGWRSTQDENFLQAISATCALSAVTMAMANGHAAANGEEEAYPRLGEKDRLGVRKLLIIDARSYTAAVANRAKGGGCECAEYYPNCEIQFMNLANIHTIRKSFHAVRALCALSPEQPSWLASVENTKWLQHISGLMRAALVVVNAVDREKRPVLVHCSDGWDRTPQVAALAELLLDPFYRTLEGFRVLIEREWLEFGHKFADRCGQGLCHDDANERCPVFLQWLDCVHQLLIQFPCEFQFNEACLVKLVQHTYSCLFGTFLCNSAQEREKEQLRQQTTSVWTFLESQSSKFINRVFKPGNEQVLRPSHHLKNLGLWQAVYLSDIVPAAAPEHDETLEAGAAGEQPFDAEAILDSSLVPKTRSCENIKAAVESEEGGTPSKKASRRLSDPNIARDLNGVNALLKDAPKSCEDTTERKPTGSQEEDSDKRTVTKDAQCDEDDDGDDVTKAKTQEEYSDLDNRDPEILSVDAEVGDNTSACSSEDGCCDGEQSNKTSEVACTADCDNSQRQNGSQQSPDTVLSNEGQEKLHPVRPYESSTDTLTEDLQLEGQGQSSCMPCGSSQKQQGLQVAEDNGSSDGDLEANNLAVSRSERLANMSTSTSDISDSRVGTQASCSNAGCSSRKLNDALLKLQIGDKVAKSVCVGKGSELVIDTQLAASMGTVKGAGSTTGTGDTDVSSSQTPSSSSPPTPAGDLRASVWVQRQVSRLMDLDGLTCHTDPIQQRLAQIEADYQQQLRLLERQLLMHKKVLHQYAAAAAAASCNGRHLFESDDMLSTESADSGEHASVGGASSTGASSDVSWEQVEEREAQITLWMPDHAVTHCAGCDCAFNLVRRKHHCRNCGQVFCHECTNFTVPVPQQHLNTPVRVCRKCYYAIFGTVSMSTNTNGFVECHDASPIS